jgi:F0F1-type ATP synthase membrane subunit b/b'
MTETQDFPQVENGIYSHSLDEYRQKVGEIIRSENEKFRELAQEQAKQIIDDAWQKAEEIIRESQKKAEKIISDSIDKGEKIVSDSRQNAVRTGNEIEQQANQTGSRIVEKARLTAQQIVQEAEEKIKREAKDTMKSQREKVLAKAKDEADSIIAEAKSDAEKKSNAIIERLKKEAQQNLEEEMVKFRADAQAQLVQIRLEAEKKAAHLIDEIANDSNEINEMIIDNIKKSETILGKFKNELQAEVADLTNNTTKARQTLEQKITRYSHMCEEETTGQEISGRPNGNTALWVTLKGEQLQKKDNVNYLFKGEIEMKSLSKFDYLKIRKLKGFMIQVPNIKYLGEFSNDEGIVLSFKMNEPLPLIDVLSNMPSVKKVETQGDNIKLILN